jgi:hypothetical protein
MTRLFALICLITILVPSAVTSSQLPQDEPPPQFGLGVILGFPTGITGAYRVQEDQFITTELGIPAQGVKGIQLQSNYLWKIPKIFPPKNAFLNLYYGFGVRFIFANKTHDDLVQVGPREIFGWTVDILNSSLEIFGELSVTVIVVPRVFMGVGIATGLRYYL